MGLIDVSLTRLSHYHFWTYEPSLVSVGRAASVAFGFLTLTTFVVACTRSITFAAPALLLVAFTITSLIHIIQLKELRLQDQMFPYSE